MLQRGLWGVVWGFFGCLFLVKFYILTSHIVGLLTSINVMSLEILDHPLRHVISRKNDLSVVQERKSQHESLAVLASLHSLRKRRLKSIHWIWQRWLWRRSFSRMGEVLSCEELWHVRMAIQKLPFLFEVWLRPEEDNQNSKVENRIKFASLFKDAKHTGVYAQEEKLET